jgi:hypothetical protein
MPASESPRAAYEYIEDQVEASMEQLLRKHVEDYHEKRLLASLDGTAKKLVDLVEKKEKEAAEKTEKYCADVIKQAVVKEAKDTETKVKTLSARIDAVGKDVESSKKDAAGMADIAGLKKLIEALTKRVADLEKKK